MGFSPKFDFFQQNFHVSKCHKNTWQRISHYFCTIIKMFRPAWAISVPSFWITKFFRGNSLFKLQLDYQCKKNTIIRKIKFPRNVLNPWYFFLTILAKNGNFYYTKFWFFTQNYNLENYFWTKNWCRKVDPISRNIDYFFHGKIRLLGKILAEISNKKSKFRLKIKILSKNRNFV